MFEEDETLRGSRIMSNNNNRASLPSWDAYNQSPGVLEECWGLLLIVTIFAINISVLWVVSRSRELWKPRHLWMACLCVTDLFVGVHKGLGLLSHLWPLNTSRELCVVQRATMGIPYVINMLLLTLLSLDRFVAVRYPFFYSSKVSNIHVAIGFVLVLLTGGSLAVASITIGLNDVGVCRRSNSLQLVYLTIVLASCSVLTLFFNSAVLRIAKKQLNAIYAQEPSFRRSTRKVSVICSNCGYKNETYVNTLLTVGDCGACANIPAIAPTTATATASTLPTVDLEELESSVEAGEGEHDNVNVPLVRTVSLPTISDAGAMIPISLDPCSIPCPEAELGDKVSSMTGLNLGEHQHEAIAIVGPMPTGGMPRSKSLVNCQSHKIHGGVGPRLQLFRNLHFARSHMFHVGRLFPSIRFARTVLLIMIPMWVFILPIVIIIPLHKGCEDGNRSELNCELVATLWRYLIVHMRSILPLQAILDTMIYAFGSKEFRTAVVKLFKRYRSLRVEAAGKK